MKRGVPAAQRSPGKPRRIEWRGSSAVLLPIVAGSLLAFAAVAEPGHPEPGLHDPATPAKTPHPLLSFQFTNELGQPVRLLDFRGQALAITFFFTRCPNPDFCPRLSKNFDEACRKLLSLTNAPANWHFLSVTFDPEFDTPAVLRSYAQTYHYAPQHWSFLTGPPERISKLAELSGARSTPDGPLLNHNFRTLVIDANGHLQTVFPIGGNLSDSLVSEILKAAAVTNGAPAGPVAAPAP